VEVLRTAVVEETGKLEIVGLGDDDCFVRGTDASSAIEAPAEESFTAERS